jgi:hypothetical protein
LSASGNVRYPRFAANFFPVSSSIADRRALSDYGYTIKNCLAAALQVGDRFSELRRLAQAMQAENKKPRPKPGFFLLRYQGKVSGGEPPDTQDPYQLLVPLSVMPE